jgi:uncharacterized membrane protein
MVPLEIAAIILYVKAIKLSPLSLTIPFLAVSPVFIILIAFILLGEFPDRSGLLGILLIVIGAYLLNIKTTKEDLSRPKTFLAIGIFTAIMVLTHFKTISMTDVAYMISVKRVSLVFSVLYGRVLFGEENIRERLTGSMLMIAGMVSITIF